MPQKILIIEDEPAIADTLIYALKTEGFDPHWCATGQAGLAALSNQSFALVVLDIGLPDGSGFEFCKSIRTRSEVPIIFLTARAAEIDRVVGLEIGGDDYLVKPFSPRELTARVKAILRRTNGHGKTPPALTPVATQSASPFSPTQTPNHKPETSSFSLDEIRCQIAYRGQPLDLTRYEFRLLKALLAHPGRVFSRDQLMTAAWEEPAASLDRTVDAHIKMLRAKLRAIDNTADPIQTHRGLGYSLRE
ncbi:MAG: two-component system response regulator CreB [Nibricoccus sp.]